MATRGRCLGLVIGWATGVVGAVLALTGIAIGSIVLFVAAMFVLGIGHGANQLARFLAADPHPWARGGTVLSLVVWAGTVGAFVVAALIVAVAVLVVDQGCELLGGDRDGTIQFEQLDDPVEGRRNGACHFVPVTLLYGEERASSDTSGLGPGQPSRRIATGSSKPSFRLAESNLEGTAPGRCVLVQVIDREACRNQVP